MPSKNFSVLFVMVFFAMACQERKQLKEMNNSTGKMNITTQSMDKTMQEMNMAMKGMNQTMQGMSDTMKNMNRTMGGMNGTMGSMNGTMQNMDDKMGHIGDTMTVMNGTMDDIATATNGMDGEIGKMSKTMTVMNGTMGHIATSTNRMDGKIGKMSNTVTLMNGSMKQMNRQLVGVDQKMGGLGTKIDAMDTKMGSLLTKIDAMDGKMGNVVTQISNTNKTLLELGSEMKSMSGKLDGMQAKMGDLLGQVTEVYDVARPGMAMTLRGHAMQELKEAEGLPGKVSAAAKYYMAQEYQVYQGKGEEGQEKRLKLFNSAVSEFILDLKNLVEDGKPEDRATSLTGAGEEIEALAVAMHRVHEIQEEFAEANKDYQQVNMFTLIEEALRFSQALEKAQADFGAAPEYVKTLMADKELIVWILKIRINTLVKMTLARISPLKDSETPTAVLWWLFKPLDIFGGPKENSSTPNFVKWEMDARKENLSVLEKVKTYLELAVETKSLLESLDYEAKLPGMLFVGIKNLDTSNIGSIPDAAVRATAESIAQFRQKLLGKVGVTSSVAEAPVEKVSEEQKQSSIPVPSPESASGEQSPKEPSPEPSPGKPQTDPEQKTKAPSASESKSEPKVNGEVVEEVPDQP